METIVFNPLGPEGNLNDGAAVRKLFQRIAAATLFNPGSRENCERCARPDAFNVCVLEVTANEILDSILDAL